MQVSSAGVLGSGQVCVRACVRLGLYQGWCVGVSVGMKMLVQCECRVVRVWNMWLLLEVKEVDICKLVLRCEVLLKANFLQTLKTYWSSANG